MVDEIADYIPPELRAALPTAEWISYDKSADNFGCAAIIDGDRREASVAISPYSKEGRLLASLIEQLSTVGTRRD